LWCRVAIILGLNENNGSNSGKSLMEKVQFSSQPQYKMTV
jgi:hypothetical protein